LHSEDKEALSIKKMNEAQEFKMGDREREARQGREGREGDMIGPGRADKGKGGREWVEIAFYLLIP
jgi:hypothetical protein